MILQYELWSIKYVNLAKQIELIEFCLLQRFNVLSMLAFSSIILKKYLRTYVIKAIQ